jgi:hypothetical protein
MSEVTPRVHKCICGHCFSTWNKIIAGISCSMHVPSLKGVQFLVLIYDLFYETAMIMGSALKGRHLTSIVFISEDGVASNRQYLYCL